MRIAFDIDGTICNNTYGKYMEARPYEKIIEFINQLYNDGHYIIFHTARGMGTFNGDAVKAYEKWYLLTAAQLNVWGVKYHELHLGKLHADIYVDDKGCGISDDGNSIEELKIIIRDLKNNRI